MAYGAPPPPDRGYRQTRPMPGGHGVQAGYAPHGPAPHGAPPSHNARSWALMAYLGQFFVGFVAPGIIYLLRNRSPFIRAHAAQGLNVAIAMTVVWVVGWMLSGTTPSLLWIPIGFMAGCVAFMIKAAMAANHGGWYRIPAVFAWRLVR